MMMSRSWRTEDLGAVAIFDCLVAVAERKSDFNWIATAEQMLAIGMTSAYEAFDYLMGNGLAAEDGSGGLVLTQLGRRTHMLMGALNGTARLEELVRFLVDDVPTAPKYQLVTSMTRDFILGLRQRPDFGRLYICSPWISFSHETLGHFVHALSLVEKRWPVEIYVLTRGNAAGAGVDALRGLGAVIAFRDDLHTKLYLREPGPSGGLEMGMLGSENLTRSDYEELGIAVRNDAAITRKLLTYFWNLHTGRMA
jgi:hypothetical protein